MNKKILLIYQTPDNGGTRTYFFHITQYLLVRGFSIYLLVKKNEFTGDIPAYCKQHKIKYTLFDDEIKDVQLYSLKNKKYIILYIYNYLKQLSFLWRVWWKIRPTTTIISQGWPFMWFRALYLPGKKIFVQHVMPLHPLDLGGKLFLKLILFFKQGTFIAVSDFAQQKMRKFWLGEYKKLQTIYNYVQINKELSRNKNRDKITILALARVEDGKNPLLWIEIAEELTKKYKHIEFIWAGKGSLLNQAKVMTQHNKRVNFIGFVKNVDELYAQTDIYFEPSKREAHGISVVGAMAWSIPAIATNNGGTIESVLNRVTGYIVNVSNKAEMIEKLEILINNASLRKQMGQKARNRYLNMFTKEIWEREMEKLI